MARNTINSLINLDYDTLVELQRKENRASLESVVRQMVTVANRRINKLTSEPIGKYSPALQNLKENTGKAKFSTKGLTKATTGKLISEYSRLKKFLTAKSSTLSGWKKIRSNIAKRTGASKLFGDKFKSDRSAKIWHNRELRFWHMYNKLKDNYGGILTQLDSNKIQAFLSKVQNMRNMAKSDDDISMVMNVYINQLYEMGDDFGGKARTSFEDEFLEKIKTENGMEEVRFAYGDLMGV